MKNHGTTADILVHPSNRKSPPKHECSMYAVYKVDFPPNILKRKAMWERIRTHYCLGGAHCVYQKICCRYSNIKGDVVITMQVSRLGCSRKNATNFRWTLEKGCGTGRLVSHHFGDKKANYSWKKRVNSPPTILNTKGAFNYRRAKIHSDLEAYKIGISVACQKKFRNPLKEHKSFTLKLFIKKR